MTRILITGSAGHLGEALVRSLRPKVEVVGVDLLNSEFTDLVGDLADRKFAHRVVRGASAIVHAATLHKPHVATHSRQNFVDTNVSGTLALLEAAAREGVEAFVFISTTSAFGKALKPPRSGDAAVWVTEELGAIPKNVYGATKTAAEDLCQLIAQDEGLPCIVLRTSRFFPEEDDVAQLRDAYDADNLKANEFLYRRVDLEDVVSATECALRRASELQFGKYIVSATTPFSHSDCAELGRGAPAVVQRYFPSFEREYARRGWKMNPTLDRVYVNSKARCDLGWQPKFDFAAVLEALQHDRDFRSELARKVGSKGYHATLV